MSAVTVVVLVIITTVVGAVPLLVMEDANVLTSSGGDIVIVTRAEWGARAPRQAPVNIPLPVNMTFIHHSAGVRSTNPAKCIDIVRGIQDFHMDDRGWNDIGYSFLVCEDGRVYEGRGWNVEGAHTLGYNSIAIGICFIGDFTKDVPIPVAIDTGKKLIQSGIDKGYIVSGFELFGHRDGRVGTECPGDAFYAMIRTWPNYSTRPIHKYGSSPANANTSPPSVGDRPNVIMQQGAQHVADKL